MVAAIEEDEDVVVADVTELVRDDGTDMLACHRAEQPFGQCHRGVFGVASGRERVGLIARHHVQPRDWDAGPDRELADCFVDLGCVGRRQWLCVGEAERNPVAVEVADDVEHDREHDEQPQERATDHRADRDHQRGETGDERPCPQPARQLSGGDPHREAPFGCVDQDHLEPQPVP